MSPRKPVSKKSNGIPVLNPPSLTVTEEKLVTGLLSHVASNNDYPPAIPPRSQNLIPSPKIQKILKPVLDRLEDIRSETLSAIEQKFPKLKNERYRDLIEGMNVLTKNIQLLSGASTENTLHTFSWEAPPQQPAQPPTMYVEDHDSIPAKELGDAAP